MALSVYLRHVNEAHSYQMQHEQQISVGDYVSAVETARAASTSYLQAADHAQKTMPVIANFLRASSFEALAQEGIANANIQLEQGNGIPRQS
ncbi:hypothetical protein [Streptomyces sp. NPDC007205]|uniref:hypothetical protein n=1 Tax=Streptomyces sp. NPDC007205 TaxID=3154316 RepID=UPI0033C1CD01